MSTVDTSLASASAAGSTPNTTTSGSADLKNSFMTLLIAQMKNQDPLNPLDNAELTSQLAQISSVQGIEQLNTTLAGINDQIDAGKTLSAQALIGHGVMVPGNKIVVGDGQSTPFGIELASDAESVLVTIKNSAGETVRKLDAGKVEAGNEAFSWDGKLEDGSVAPDGAYTVSIEAKSSSGAGVTVTALNYAQVGGVKANGKDPILQLGALFGEVKLSEVRQYF
ncbi:flagellar hook assembly protein FlgD [Pseudomonas aeruginosa]